MAITKEQIVALINAKIAGQGSAVDVGGALPAILKGLADMGISSDMAETEQMQARKDLGLYYEETTTGEKTASYTDEQEEPSGLWKISDDTPSKDDVVGVSVGGGDPTLANYELVDIDGGYVITLLNIDPKFQIIFEETGGKTPGIYCTSSGKLASLVYNGEITVVSKVPEKYLPIAWNQLVIEGTKIAEVTIGEETTNVFAPEGGGALPWLEINDFLPNTGSNQNISSFISQADYEKLVDGEYAGIHIIGNTSIMSQRDDEYLYCISSRLTMANNTKSVFLARCGYIPNVLSGDKNALYIFTIFGNSVESVTITSPRVYIGDDLNNFSRSLTITILPTAGTGPAMSLALATGFSYGTSFDPSNISGISYTDGSGNKYLSPVKIENPSNGNTKYSFDMAGNHYEIVFNVGDDEATVTVTPLS